MFPKGSLVSDSSNDNKTIEQAKATVEDLLQKLKLSSEQQQPLDELTYAEALSSFKQLTDLIEQLAKSNDL